MNAAAPDGAIVSITYDTEREVDSGHFLRTKTGRIYRVVAARRVKRRIGMHYQTPRYAISAVVVDVTLPAEHPHIHELHWYSRNKK